MSSKSLVEDLSELRDNLQSIIEKLHLEEREEISSPFSIGQTVRVKGCHDNKYLVPGMLGKVVGADITVLVEFPLWHHGHSGVVPRSSSNSKSRWWLRTEDLDVVDD